MKTRWILALALGLATTFASTATAQEAATASGPAYSATDAQSQRAYVRGVLERDEVRKAARIAGADLDGALANVDRLDGPRLERAVRQARLVDRQLDGQRDTIVISATTVIIILLLLIIIIVAS